MSIQVDAKTQKITHRDEGVGLLKLVKLWKLLLVSLWLLMTIHLLKERMEILTLYFCQLFEYLYIFYCFIDFPRPIYTCLCQNCYR